MEGFDGDLVGREYSYKGSTDVRYRILTAPDPTGYVCVGQVIEGKVYYSIHNEDALRKFLANGFEPFYTMFNKE